MKPRKILMLIVLIVGMVFAFNTTQAQTSKIGVIDLQLVFDNHPNLSAAQTKYARAVEEYQLQLEQLNENADQQQMVAQMQEALLELEMQLQDELLMSVMEVAEQLANELELEMVVDKTAVFFGGLDISKQVIENL